MKTFAWLLPLMCMAQIQALMGQEPINFEDCQHEMFFVSAEKRPCWQNEAFPTVMEYFEQYLEDRYIDLSGVNGRVVMGILIDENGKTCCQHVTDLTGSDLNPLIFKDAVNKMPRWAPATQKSQPVPFLHHVILYIENGQLVKRRSKESGS